MHTEEQIVVVAKLANEIWHEHYTPIIGSDQVRYMLDRFQSAEAIQAQIDDGYTYFLVTEDDAPVGYAAAQVRQEKHDVFLSKLYVKKELRGRGYGRMMVEAIEKMAHNAHCSAITLTVNKNNTASIAAYRKMGFIVDAPCVTDIGNGFVMDDFRMTKEV